MVDVVNKTCTADGCSTRPSFGFDTDYKRLRCSEHRQEGEHLAWCIFVFGVLVVELSMSDKESIFWM